MSNLHVVIPAAGKSQRFFNAGYTTPKPLLKIRNNQNDLVGTMLEHVYCTIPSGFVDITVGLPDTYSGPELVLVEYRKIESTLGQADTVYQLIKDLPEDDRVLVLDCDVLLHEDDIRGVVGALEVADLSVAVTETFDPNASRVDVIPYPTRFVEKEPISSWGIVSARAFRHAALLKDALETTLEECKKSGEEPYLSMALNHYPGMKYAYKIDRFQDWGTPERLHESGAEIVE